MAKDVAYYLSKGFDRPMAEYFASGRKRITSVSPNDDFTLTLGFDNGETRVLDCKPFLEEGTVFAPFLRLENFRRVYLDGCSYQELAQELGNKPNTLASRVSRIKAKFRKNFPDSEHFLQDGCKESRPPGHKEGRGGSEP